MKRQDQSRRTFALYGVVLVFVFGFFFLGLWIGEGFVSRQESRASAASIDPSRQPPAPSAPIVDVVARSEGTSESVVPDPPRHREGSQETAVREEQQKPDETATAVAEPEQLTEESVAEGPAVDDQEAVPVKTPAGGYTIQVGAYSTVQEANQLLVKLKAEGFEGRVRVPAVGEANRYYRVWCGEYASLQDARPTEDRLKLQGFNTYTRRID